MSEVGKDKHLRKLVDLEKLSETIKQAKVQNKKVVLTTGVFDIFHPGHLYYLEEIACCGDILVVGLAADKIVKKGPGRPIFNEKERRIILAGLEAVDYPVIFTDLFDFVRQINPDIWVISPTSNEQYNKQKMDFASQNNIRIIVLESAYPLHTSDIIAKIKKLLDH